MMTTLLAMLLTFIGLCSAFQAPCNINTHNIRQYVSTNPQLCISKNIFQVSNAGCKTKGCISNMNANSEFSRRAISLQLLALIPYTVFSAQQSAKAEVSFDLSDSPLKTAKPSIVVEGAARIVDGDTIVIENSKGEKERVRLLGIDAPESKQTCTDNSGKPYSCGVEAKQTLEKLVGRDPVKCIAAKRDQYSRVLGVCFDEKTGQQLNKELVVEGEAVAYEQYSKAYVSVEEGARKQGRGVWKGKFDKPWEFRKARRSASKAKAEAAAASKAAADASDADLE